MDNEEFELVLDRIDHAGKPVTVFLDPKGKLCTQIRDLTRGFKYRDAFLVEGCKVVGVYDIGVYYKDLVADVQFARGE